MVKVVDLFHIVDDISMRGFDAYLRSKFLIENMWVNIYDNMRSTNNNFDSEIYVECNDLINERSENNNA